MATSNTRSFDMDLLEICEEAYDRCGLKMKTGYDYRLARRSLDLLLIEWQNRGINFWTLNEDTTALTAGSQSLALPTTVVDVLEFFIRIGTGSSQVDHPVTQVSSSDWAAIPNKNTEGRPTNVWLEKSRGSHVLHFWPVPNQAYTLYYHQLLRIEDTGTPASNTLDVPHRFLPALVAGLAYRIAEKRAPDRKADLKADYEEQWMHAEAGDRDRSTLRLLPDMDDYR